MTPYHTGTFVTLYHGECVALMDAMPEASIDALVTDPPYGLEFMGTEWDRLGGIQGWHDRWATAALRVLKPGAHLLAFGGTRTHHRLMCALEDAGFEIRDCLMWLYGSGFPKSLDVSKAIDKAAGAEREVVGVKPGHENFVDRIDPHSAGGRSDGWERPWRNDPDAVTRSHMQTAPATDAARTWQGWGTALKPAWEPIILARKPLAAKNVAANVLAYGTGAINVDGGRIGTAEDTRRNAQGGANGLCGTSTRERHAEDKPQPLGRWPANLVLDADAARLLDEASGELHPPMTTRRGRGIFNTGLPEPASEQRPSFSDTGGASRFFYTAKASPEDRDGATHPTVKPTDLMAWLVKLVTPPVGVVLDPFAGSGSTLLAARSLGITSIGIDREESYLRMAVHRLRQEVLAL